MAWYRNQGWNRNLRVLRSGGPTHYQIDVYVVAIYQFHNSPGAPAWTPGQADRWKHRFASQVYDTWSEQWTLLSDISCAPIDVDRAAVQLPDARVRVHVIEHTHPSTRHSAEQRVYAIKVFRRAPDEARQRQHAHSDRSRATIADISAGEEPPRGIATAEIYEDSLDPSPSPFEGYSQIVAMHEFGHMLGLMHPNDMEEGCMGNRSAPFCYGEEYSPEARSIMGRGMEVRREDYRIFVRIISGLVREVSSQAFPISRTHRLHWFVRGSVSQFCEGDYRHTARLDSGALPNTQGRARRPGPSLGLA